MSTTDTISLDSPADLQAEFDDLRRGLLPMFLFPLLGVPLIWLAYSAIRDWSRGPIYLVDLAVLVLVLFAYLAITLRNEHYTCACWVFIAGLVVADCLVIAAHPETVMTFFGLLVVIVAQALLGGAQSFLAGTLMWAAATITSGFGTGYFAPSWSTFGMLVLYGLVWVTTWLSARPLKTSVAWSLNGWEHARDLVYNTKERRGELYRALKALEEATYRIERMNGELLMARHEAEVARAHKARFAAMVSHELRGPLNLILGYSRLMALSPEKYGEPLPPTYRADVATIYHNSQHLADLVDDILDLSQIEAQSLPLVKDRVDLEQDVVEEALRIVRPLAERKGLYLREELAGDLPLLLADEVRLRQVMLNILTNAIRFTERGSIMVRTMRQKDHLLVSVQDTGLGIAPEKMSKLFQEFYQAHMAEDSEQGSERRGSGLGLAISKHLIELHAGHIWAESRVGIGTTLYFDLPLPGTEPALASELKTGESPHRAREHDHYLIVNADLAIVRPLTRHFEGYRVVGVPEAQEIIPLVEELHPWAVLTSADLAREICEQLSAKGFDVPVIGCIMPGIENQAHLEGAFSYLIKPITPEMIMMVMRQVERDQETTVLLVDDDPDAVRLLEIMLLSLPRPYKILKAYDGLQALQAMQQAVPDVVFLDLIMPGLDGQGTMARMRADERLRDVPVAIISARDIVEGVISLGTPLSVHRRKPIDLARASRCLKAILDELTPDYLPARVS